MPTDIEVFKLQVDILFKDEEFIKSVTEFSARFSIPREEVVKNALQFYMRAFMPVLHQLAMYDSSAPVPVFHTLANPDTVTNLFHNELVKALSGILPKCEFEVDLDNVTRARFVLPED